MSFEEFRKVIASVSNLELQQIQENSSFREDLGIDSLQMVNLIVELSQQFELELNAIGSNADLQTVRGLYNSYIKGVNNGQSL